MTQRTRQHEDTPVPPTAAAGGTTGGPPALFSRAQTLAARMLDVVDGRSSSNSQRFVEQSRQFGGQ